MQNYERKVLHEGKQRIESVETKETLTVGQRSFARRCEQCYVRDHRYDDPCHRLERHGSVRERSSAFELDSLTARHDRIVDLSEPILDL